MALLTSPPSKPKAHVFVPLSRLSHQHRGNVSSRRPVPQLSLFPKFGTIIESKFEKRLTNTNLVRFFHANNDRRAAGPVSSQTEGFWFSHMSWLIDSNSEAQRGMRVKWDYHITWLADDLLSFFDFWFGDYNLRPLLVLSESYQMARQPQFPCTGVRLGTSRPEHVNKRVSAFATQSRSPPQADDDVDWVQATSAFFENDTRPIMLFDGVCNLCNGGVKFVRDNDRNRIMRFEALQSEAGKNLLRRSGRAPDDISSVVLVEKDRSYIKSEAVLKIMEYINLPFPQLAFFLQFVPLFVRDFAYDRVANNRYTIFGRSESCEL